MKRTFLSLVSMAFICAMTLTSCDEIMSTIDNPVGSYVQFNDSVLNLTPGQVAQNVATTISTEKVTYTSSDKSIATVDPNGFVTAIAFGEATITASVKATEYYAAGSATYKVKVGSEAEKALKEGATVEVVLQDGENKIEPKFVNEKGVFTLQNPLAGANSTLTYDKAKNLITFTQQKVVFPASETVITVIFDVTNNTYQAYPAQSTTTAQFAAIKINGKDVTGKVTKKEVAATAVTISAPSPFVMAVGDADVTLKAEVSPADATDKKVTWSSSAPAVATVDQTGKVHAVAAGTTTIKATTANGKEASVELTVNLPKATATAPTAKTGVKAGENAAIINAGVASGGTMMYAVTTTNTKPTSTDGFSATVPTAQSLAAGTCYVWYYVKADATHADSDIEGSVPVTIAAAGPTLNLTNPAVGQLIGDDGKNYAYGSVPSGVKAVAKICYSNGIKYWALALTDDADVAMKWVDANQIAVAHQPAFTNGTWRLPTGTEWQAMRGKKANYASLRDGFASVGGTNMASANYWGASYDKNNADFINLNDTGITGQVSKNNDNYKFRVRAVLVF